MDKTNPSAPFARGRALLLTALALAGCGDEIEPLVIARCHADAECGAGKVCEDGACVPKDNVSCLAVEGGQAILQPGPPVVEFGQVGQATSFKDLALRNIGNCTLTIFEASFESGPESPFACPGCTPEAFPLELFPLRDKQLELAFTPAGVGEFRDVLVLLSDDAEFPQIRVPVRARYKGLPEPNVVPDHLDFGFVPVGRTVTQGLQISNRGTGEATLLITHVEIQPTGTTAFSYGPELMDAVELVPLRMNQDAVLNLNVRYHPREIGVNKADLVITTNLERNGIIRVPIEGTSQTPPKISVSPPSIQFGAVPLGTTNADTLTIVNEGGSPLEVRYRWGGTGLSTDLSALPQLIPPIPPGQFTEVQVFVTATAPAPISGLLILESNDPSRPTVSIPVSAEGQDVVGAQVVKIEMSFTNSDNSFFDNDFRNVDLTLENPFGLICNKQNANPTNWGAFGTPTWISLGPTEEPERIVLVGAQQDGVYRLMVTYQEDCAALPSAVLSAILGISIDVVLGVVLGVAIPGVDGGRISDVIDDICFDHESSTATLTIYVNGQIIAEVPAQLSRKGDYLYPVELVRSGGVFTVR
ncbi:MAG: choice-of-anchor D domain-containing protein [Deltaproteobacteria bacterium]|nr:choice-of-anchor D domain-containing protein [Deltaproteobacteria bacterium]